MRIASVTACTLAAALAATTGEGKTGYLSDFVYHDELPATLNDSGV